MKNVISYIIFIGLTALWAQDLLKEMDVSITRIEQGVSVQPNSSKMIVKSIIPKLSFESNKSLKKVEKIKDGEWRITLYPGNQRIEIKADGYLSYSERITFDKQKVYECIVREKLENNINNYDTELFEVSFIYDVHEVYAAVNDFSPILSIKNRSIFKLPSGEYTFQFKKTGYRPHTEHIRVDEDVFINIKLEEDLQYIEVYQTPGIILINSEPANAEVIFDGQKIGNTPITITGVIPGQHQLGLIKNKYFSEQMLVNLESSEIKNIDIELKPNYGYLNVISHPDTCIILMNDKVLNMTPIYNYPIESGSYQLIGRKNLYHDFNSSELIIKNQDTIYIEFALEPAFGILNILTEPENDVEIYLDRSLIGKSPLENFKYTSGAYTIELKKQYYQTIIDEINISDNKNTNRTFLLTSNVGTLIVNSFDTELFIEDTLIEQAHDNIKLIPGIYTIQAKRDNYYTESKEVVIYKGMTEKIDFDLLPKIGSITVLIDSSIQYMKSEIIIDNEFAGTVPLIKKLIIGDHTIEINIDGKKIKKDITIEKNKDRLLTLNNRDFEIENISINDTLFVRENLHTKIQVDLEQFINTNEKTRLDSTPNVNNTAIIPNLFGVDITEAKDRLKSLNINIGEILYVKQNNMKNKITLIHPKPGQELVKGDKIILVVGE